MLTLWFVLFSLVDAEGYISLLRNRICQLAKHFFNRLIIAPLFPHFLILGNIFLFLFIQLKSLSPSI